jgi:hypothetical protein
MPSCLWYSCSTFIGNRYERGLFPLLQLRRRISNRESKTGWQRARVVISAVKKTTGSSPPLEGIGSNIMKEEYRGVERDV